MLVPDSLASGYRGAPREELLEFWEEHILHQRQLVSVAALEAHQAEPVAEQHAQSFGRPWRPVQESPHQTQAIPLVAVKPAPEASSFLPDPTPAPLSTTDHQPRRLQTWREANELEDRELMRDGRWIIP